MVVLSPSKVMLYVRQSGQWAPSAAIPLSPPRPWPRDLRGHLRVNAAKFQTYLPGMACSGAVEPALTLECRTSEEPWVLESGSRAILLGYFAAARNYFDGRVITQNGVKKNVPPFYSAASAEEQGRTLWLLSMVDGRTEILDASLDPAGTIPSWGSDIMRHGCALRKRIAGAGHEARRWQRYRRPAGICHCEPLHHRAHAARGASGARDGAVAIGGIFGGGRRSQSRDGKI